MKEADTTKAGRDRHAESENQEIGEVGGHLSRRPGESQDPYRVMRVLEKNSVADGAEKQLTPVVMGPGFRQDDTTGRRSG
jgi:hypothetical protein